MSPPAEKRTGPATNEAGQESLTTNAVSLPLKYGRRGATGPRCCEHLRPRNRWCSKCVNRRRRWQRELEAIAPVHSEWADAPWCSGLSTDQRRAEANRLVATCGWSVEDAAQVVGVEPRRSA